MAHGVWLGLVGSNPGGQWGTKDDWRCDSEGDRGQVWDEDLALGTDHDNAHLSPFSFTTALFESLSLMIICDIFSLLMSRTGFSTRLKSKKVKISKEKLSKRAVVKERRLGRVFPQERRRTPIGT